MALAAVRTETPVSLADRIAEAQRAEVRPRNRLADLQGQFGQALEAKDYASADRLQGELQAAREALVMAEALTRGLREGQALSDAQRAEEQQSVRRAREVAEARLDIEAARIAEAQALDGIEESLAQLWATIGAAQDAYRQALALERRALDEKRRWWQARVTAGEADTVPGRIMGPDPASILIDTVPLIKQLMTWTGPERATPRPVITAAAAPSGSARPFGGGGLVRSSPWPMT